MFDGSTFSADWMSLSTSAKSVARSEVITNVAVTVAWPCCTTELNVCRSCVPARYCSIGATMLSRISVTDAPLYCTVTVTVG